MATSVINKDIITQLKIPLELREEGNKDNNDGK